MGCGDFVIAARNSDDSVALILNGPQLAEAAHTAAEATTTTHSLADSDVRLWVDVGSNVTHEVCNDALHLEVVVDQTYQAVSGDLVITMTPNGKPKPHGGFPADAQVVMENVVLGLEDGSHSVTIESMTLESFVGWLPG